MLSDLRSVPRVGVGVMIFKDGKILLGRRKNAVGSGTHSFPGGHLELMESWTDCARREIAEECGIQVKNFRFQFIANSHFKNRHMVHIGLIADWESGEPQLLEPDKCEGWDWYSPGALPEPMSVYFHMISDVERTGKVCVDSDGHLL